MKPKLLMLTAAGLLFSICLFAQKKKKGAISNRVICNYGDVKPDDFAPTLYPIDSSAEAIYLFKGGHSRFEGNTNGFFDVEYTVHERIRLMKKNSFDDLAKIEITTYKPARASDEHRITNLEAATYNIENGQVAVTKLDKASLFKEKNGDYLTTKFTFPNLKEGSIIEYTYTLKYPASSLYLAGWQFQTAYPSLWSEYETEVPQMYEYVMLKQGYVPYTIDTVKISHDNYNIVDGSSSGASRSISVSSNTINNIWAIKDVPALKPENYTTTMRNHVAKIEFQLSAIRYPNSEPKMIMRTWQDVSDELIKDEDFGASLARSNNYFDDDIKAAVAGAKDSLEKATKIYEYVRNNFSCTDNSAMYLSQPLKKTYQTRKGNVADINLLLTSMLLSQGVESYPVLLSTTDHGKAYELYPILSKYNYVICQMKLNHKSYLLDASNNKLGFNRLNTNCYNGYMRVVNPLLPELIDLSADSLRESEVTSVFVINGKDHKLMATVNTTKGYEQSLSLRDKFSKSSQTDYFANLKKSYSENVEIKNEAIDSLQLLDMPLKLTYDLSIDNDNDEDILYFNPILAGQEKENPFAAAERYYPVEMPYCSDETYILNMDIPEGYEVDELPKSSRVKLNEDQGMFEYLIAKGEGKIQLRVRVKLEKATYEPGDYATLRDFYAFIVKKEAEQIVFKKIK